MKRENFSSVTITIFLAMFAMSLMTFLPLGGAREAAAENMKIGFILKTMQEERYQTDKSLFIARAEALGAQVLFDSSRNNELTQLQQVEKMLEEGIQLLVLQPVNTGTAGNLVRLAHEKALKLLATIRCSKMVR